MDPTSAMGLTHKYRTCAITGTVCTGAGMVWPVLHPACDKPKVQYGPSI
jgi:hypothetical protein